MTALIDDCKGRASALPRDCTTAGSEQRSLAAGICRSLARHIWRQKQQFDAYGLKLVCLVRLLCGTSAVQQHADVWSQLMLTANMWLQIHQLLPGELESFQSFWPGEAYIDINKLLYKELGRGRLPKLSRFQFWPHHFEDPLACEELPRSRS